MRSVVSGGEDTAAAVPSAAPLPADTARRRGLWRLALAAALTYAAIRGLALWVTVLVLPHLPPSQGQPYTLAFFIRSWDAYRYQLIAAHGYHYIPHDHAARALFAWFPGYPAAIDAFAWIPGVGPMHAAFIVTAASGLAAAAGLTLLVEKITGNPRAGLLTAALWAVAPGSIVLEMNYPEALLCAIAAWGLLALVHRRWLTAGLLAAAAGLMHGNGIALAVAVAVAALPELLRAIRRRAAADCWRPAAALAIAPLGFLGFLGYVAWSWDRLDAWFRLEHRDGSAFDAGYGIVRSVALLHADPPGTRVGPTVAILATCAAAVVLTLWLIIARHRLGGVPASVLWYTATIVFVALTSGPYNFGGKPRYLLPALVLGLPPAALLARVPRWLQVAVIALVTIAATWLNLYRVGANYQP
jgi:hypothetical protein